MLARRAAEKLAKETTRWIGRYWGEALGFYYVTEFPKSGGTWVAQMLGDYLQLPFPRFILLPVAFSCVLQNHWAYDPRLRRVLYLYRDGRDVMVSLYFDRLRVARHSSRPGRESVRRTYEKLFGRGYDPADVERHLPRFIEHEFTRPGHGTPVNWSEHVDGWTRPGRDETVVLVSYEDLRKECVRTLGRAITALTGESTDTWRLETTVEKMSMARQTGRRPGEEDLTNHIRKGIVGDWSNHFSREASEVFDHFAGEALIRLGYEPSRDWVARRETGGDLHGKTPGDEPSRGSS